MGNSDSRPAFDFEAQLLADTSKPQTVAVEDPTTASPTATLPRRSHVAEKGLITVPYASQTARAQTRRSRQWGHGADQRRERGDWTRCKQ